MSELFALFITAFLHGTIGIPSENFGQILPPQQIEVAAPVFPFTDFKPLITAPAALITDRASGGTIWSRNAEEKRAPASLTKLMTVLLILENHDFSEVVTIPFEATQVPGARMYLQSGERITVGSLLKGIMIPSANDAALALAIFHAGSEQEFVTEMNRRAYFLGMIHTHFQNPHGLDAPEHFSTAHDLSILARKVLEYPVIRAMAHTKLETVFSTDGEFVHELNTTNELLFSPFPVFGLKTGTTDEAGQCLITLFQSDSREVLFVVLGSTNRFRDTKALLSPFLEK